GIVEEHGHVAADLVADHDVGTRDPVGVGPPDKGDVRGRDTHGSGDGGAERPVRLPESDLDAVAQGAGQDQVGQAVTVQVGGGAVIGQDVGAESGGANDRAAGGDRVQRHGVDGVPGCREDGVRAPV